MLEIKNLSKTFTKKNQKTKESREVGVFDLSFTANPGKILGFIGANGAGKTTTMRTIADLTIPDKGEILLNGKKYKDIKDLKNKVAFVSGDTNIFDRMTPREILSLFGQLSDIDKDLLNTRIVELSEMLQMQDFLDEISNDFSTGMRQKTSIARALITEPDVLIFDEVTNGLDIFASKSLKEIILNLKHQNKIILYSTHIMNDADELCDEILIVHKGKTVISGEKSEIIKKNNVKNINELFFKLVKNTDE